MPTRCDMGNDKNILERLFARGNSYWLTRFVILRLLGFVYAIAFLVAANQLVPLIGEHGLTPATNFLGHLPAYYGSRSAAIWHVPTLFWLGISDNALSICAWVGFGLSLVVLAGYANVILMSILWMMYMSIVHIGDIWYGYGWEIQLLETGFLSIFLCPLLDPRPFPKSPPPILVIWLFRWLGFRIMIGAGLIKLRGDPCWRDLTCMYYHYETQPIPNPISRYLHFAPHWLLKFETAWNHFVELVVPWFSFGPRLARHVAGVLLITFQMFLIISGNLSFLNYLTIVPFLACLDDTFLRRVLPNAVVRRAERAATRIATRADSERSDDRIVDPRGVAERPAGAESRFRPSTDELLVQPARSREHVTARSARSVGSATKLFSKGRTAFSSPAPNGKNTNSKRNRAIRIGGRRLSRRISRGSTGKSGSRPWPRRVNIRGHSTSSGNFCKTIAAPYRSSPTIHFRKNRRTTSGRGFTDTDSLHRARKRGGAAS